MVTQQVAGAKVDVPWELLVVFGQCHISRSSLDFNSVILSMWLNFLSLLHSFVIHGRRDRFTYPQTCIASTEACSYACVLKSQRQTCLDCIHCADVN